MNEVVKLCVNPSLAKPDLSGALNERSATAIMKKDKFMLVLRIVQCLSKHMDISMTTFRKIPYVLQCCEIDLGLKF